MSLTEQLIEMVDAAVKVNEYDRRSAIGLARSWVDKREPIRANPDQIEYPNRDQLARGLVTLLESASDRDAQIEALQSARAYINAPFVDATMLGFQASRLRLAKPGEKKKAREAAKSDA